MMSWCAWENLDYYSNEEDGGVNENRCLLDYLTGCEEDGRIDILLSLSLEMISYL